MLTCFVYLLVCVSILVCVCECVYVFAVLVSVLTLGIEHKRTGNMMYVEHYAASTFRESIVTSFFFTQHTLLCSV